MLLVTVRATPDPLDITANLRAPLVIRGGRGYQVINAREDAPLRAPLFVLPAAAPAEEPRSMDAA
jgi:flagellar assembly factor FliW